MKVYGDEDGGDEGICEGRWIKKVANEDHWI